MSRISNDSFPYDLLFLKLKHPWSRKEQGNLLKFIWVCLWSYNEFYSFCMCCKAEFGESFPLIFALWIYLFVLIPL